MQSPPRPGSRAGRIRDEVRARQDRSPCRRGANATTSPRTASPATRAQSRSPCKGNPAWASPSKRSAETYSDRYARIKEEVAERQRREQGGVHTPTKDPAAALPHSAATTPATSTPTLAATPAATATEDADPGPPAAGERRAEASTPKDNTGVSATKPGARRDARKAVAASVASADEAIAAAIALVNVSPCRSSASIKRPKPKEGRPVACGSGAEAPTAKPAATSAPRPATPRIGPSPSPDPSPSPALKPKPTSQSKAKSGAVAKPKSSGKGSKKGSGSTPPQNREWAHGDLLAEALAIQATSNFDPDSLFFEFRETGCDLEEIFQRLSISYTARGSTGNWEADRITPTEELVYKRQCGYETMPSLTDLTEPEEDGGDVEAERAGAV